jgi:hypothetical protein
MARSRGIGGFVMRGDVRRIRQLARPDLQWAFSPAVFEDKRILGGNHTRDRNGRKYSREIG